MTYVYHVIFWMGLGIAVLAGWLAIEMSRRMCAEEELSDLRQKTQARG